MKCAVPSTFRATFFDFPSDGPLEPEVEEQPRTQEHGGRREEGERNVEIPESGPFTVYQMIFQI